MSREWRAAAVIVLLMIAAVALRGYLPGHQRTVREPSNGSPATLIVIVALLFVSLAIIAIAVIERLRDPRVGPDTTGGLRDMPETLGKRPRWRFWLIGLAVILAWLAVVFLLARLGAPMGLDQLPFDGPSSTTTPENGTAPATRTPEPDAGGSVLGYGLAFLAATVILLLMLGAGGIVASRRHRRVTQPYIAADDRSASQASALGSETLARAAELGLAEIGDLSREPREAIIACYAAMERGLAKAPGAVPQDSDTPSEVLARAVEHHALQVDSATELVELFAEARFSMHVMNEAHREVAVRVLRLVLAELRSLV